MVWVQNTVFTKWEVKYDICGNIPGFHQVLTPGGSCQHWEILVIYRFGMMLFKYFPMDTQVGVGIPSPVGMNPILLSLCCANTIPHVLLPAHNLI